MEASPDPARPAATASDPVLPWPESFAGHADLRDRLLASYRSPARGYHDARHLAEVLERVEELLADETADRDAVLLAAWFHDAVYDGAGDDEERSARLAERELAAAGAAPALVAEVSRLVRLTADHRTAPGDTNAAVLCDADLAILAAGPGRYREYVAGVRREYADVPEPDFRAGRARVLRALVDQPALFRTRHARRHWEETARSNVAAELRELEDGAAGS